MIGVGGKRAENLLATTREATIQLGRCEGMLQLCLQYINHPFFTVENILDVRIGRHWCTSASASFAFTGLRVPSVCGVVDERILLAHVQLRYLLL